MPVYSYKCKECDHEFEEEHKVDARNVPRYNPCPNCGTSDKIILTIKKINVGDSIAMGRTKPPIEFRERLKQIEDTYSKPAGQKLNSRYID